MEAVSSVGRKITQNFKVRVGKKKVVHQKDDLDLLNTRKGSTANLIVPPSFGDKSKSSSMGSINNASMDATLGHDDVMALTFEVRSFSEALAKLKDVFELDDEEYTDPDQNISIEAHDKLGEVLKILQLVLRKYPALHTTDVLTAAAVLITKIRSYHYDDANADPGDLHFNIDQLAIAFSSSVSDYLMGDLETGPMIEKTKSYDNLVSNESLDQDEGLDCSDGALSMGYDLDERMVKIDAGVEKALQHAKSWSKYAKDIITFVDKRTHLEMEFAKNMTKLSDNTRQAVMEEHCLPFQSIFCTALDQEMDHASNIAATCNLLQKDRFVEPLSTRRSEHDKIRKSLKDNWSKENRRMHDALSNMKKARNLYVQRQQDYQKAKEGANKAESESLGQSAGVTKFEKKKKLEEEAMHKAIEAETTYKSCVVEANLRHQNLEVVKGRILTEVRDLINYSDQVMKSVAIQYFQLVHTVTAPLPVQYQALRESGEQYDCGSQYAEFVRRQPTPNEYYYEPEPYVFEPYEADDKALELRKPSSQSSGSSDGHFYGEDSPQTVGKRIDKGKNKPRLWAHHGTGSDTDSISGGSCKSQESSPTASPYQGHRRLLGPSSSLGELIEKRNDDENVVSDSSMMHSFLGVMLSKPARTHVFRKLRTPSRCRECESYVYFQGAECEKCGLASHKKCLESLHWECGHKRNLDRRMTTFGVDFKAHVEETKTEIPHLVRKCTWEIDDRGLEVKGIYRVSGVKSKVERLCQSFEIDEGNVDLADHHPNVIANVLKLYLRQLPEPLLTFKLYTDFIKLAKEDLGADKANEAETIKKLIKLVETLPKPNFRTSSMLMYHLKRVSDHEPFNQMSASNLGIVFGPTLLRPSEGAASLNSLMDTPNQTRIVELLILNNTDVFGPEEVIPGAKKFEKPATEEEIKEEKSESPAGDNNWGYGAPVIKESLLDELAKEEPRFNPKAAESGDTPEKVKTAESPDTDHLQTEEESYEDHTPDYSFDDESFDTLLPDDSNTDKSHQHHHAKMPTNPTIKIRPPPADLGDLPSPATYKLSKPILAGSPGLKRALLPTDIRATNTEGQSNPNIQLTKPQPFDPPKNDTFNFVEGKSTPPEDEKETKKSDEQERYV